MRFLGESKNGFVISDHSDHGASKEPTIPVPLMHHDSNDLRSQIRFGFSHKHALLVSKETTVLRQWGVEANLYQ